MHSKETSLSTYKEVFYAYSNNNECKKKEEA